jgi:hypothetical protein
MTAAMVMHRDRTEWTPAEATVELVTAVARGELDAWSGCFLRAGVDTAESLHTAAVEISADPASTAVPSPIRRLGIIRWGDDDPYTG